MILIHDLNLTPRSPILYAAGTPEQAVEVYSSLSDIARATMHIETVGAVPIVIEDISILIDLKSWIYSFIIGNLKRHSEIVVDIYDRDLLLKFRLNNGIAEQVELSTRRGNLIGHYELANTLSAADLFDLAQGVFTRAIPLMGADVDLLMYDPITKDILRDFRNSN